MISVIYCTREENSSHKNHIIKTSGLAKKIEVIEIINKGESLTKAYNRGLKMAKNDIVVFCHDDIIFEKNGWATKLLNHFKNTNYGIIGIAGTTDLPSSGMWWEDRTKMVGSVKHSHNGKTWENKYSGIFTKKIIETVIVDGLFFAVDKKRIKETFDESVNGFHFYEIDFCFRNHLKDVKIGVTFDVKVIHKSIGMTNEEWDKNRILFSEKYKSELPKKIKVSYDFENKISQIKKEPKVKILVSSSGNIEGVKNIISSIKQMNYKNYEIKIVLNTDSETTLEDLNDDSVEVVEGVYTSLHKNVSILKWDSDIINDKDELILFLNDQLSIKTNLLNKFVSVYLKNKNTFGSISPRIINKDYTMISSGIDLVVLNQGEKSTLQVDFKGMNSYFNYKDGLNISNLGNLGLCYMTTYKNLEDYGWFKLDYEEFLYESDFSAKCTTNGKTCFVDNDSVVSLSYNLFNDEFKKENLTKDINNLFKSLSENEKTKKLIKTVNQQQLQPQV